MPDTQEDDGIEEEISREKDGDYLDEDQINKLREKPLLSVDEYNRRIIKEPLATQVEKPTASSLATQVEKPTASSLATQVEKPTASSRKFNFSINLSLEIQDEKDEQEIKLQFDSIASKYFNKTNKVLINIASNNVRRLFHLYANESKLYHWTNNTNSNTIFNLSNRDEDKQAYDKSQEEFKLKSQPPIIQKQRSIDEQLANMNLGPIQKTALIAERLTISSPKPSSEAMAMMQELDLMPKAKSKAKSKVPEQVFSPRVTRSIESKKK